MLAFDNLKGFNFHKISSQPAVRPVMIYIVMRDRVTLSYVERQEKLLLVFERKAIH